MLIRYKLFASEILGQGFLHNMTTQQTYFRMHDMHHVTNHVTTEVLPKIVLVQKFYQRDASLFKNAHFDGLYKFSWQFHEYFDSTSFFCIFLEYNSSKLVLFFSTSNELRSPHNCKAHSNDGMQLYITGKS